MKNTAIHDFFKIFKGRVFVNLELDIPDIQNESDAIQVLSLLRMKDIRQVVVQKLLEKRDFVLRVIRECKEKLSPFIVNCAKIYLRDPTAEILPVIQEDPDVPYQLLPLQNVIRSLVESDAPPHIISRILKDNPVDSGVLDGLPHTRAFFSVLENSTISTDKLVDFLFFEENPAEIELILRILEKRQKQGDFDSTLAEKIIFRIQHFDEYDLYRLAVHLTLPYLKSVSALYPLLKLAVIMKYPLILKDIKMFGGNVCDVLANIFFTDTTVAELTFEEFADFYHTIEEYLPCNFPETGAGSAPYGKKVLTIVQLLWKNDIPSLIHFYKTFSDPLMKQYILFGLCLKSDAQTYAFFKDDYRTAENDPERKFLDIIALAIHGDAEVLPEITNFLQRDLPPEKRILLETAVNMLAEKRPLEFVNTVRTQSQPVKVNLLRAIKRAENPVLIRVLLEFTEHGDADIIIATVPALAKTCKREIFDKIVEITFSSENDAVRQAGISALGGIPSTALLDLLEKKLNDPRENIRRNAALTLARLSEMFPDTPSYLIRIARAGGTYVKDAVAYAFQHIKYPPAVYLLTELLAYDDIEVRRHAIRALAHQQDISTAEKIANLWHIEPLREDILYALEKMRSYLAVKFAKKLQSS